MKLISLLCLAVSVLAVRKPWIQDPQGLSKYPKLAAALEYTDLNDPSIIIGRGFRARTDGLAYVELSTRVSEPNIVRIECNQCYVVFESDNKATFHVHYVLADYAPWIAKFSIKNGDKITVRLGIPPETARVPLNYVQFYGVAAEIFWEVHGVVLPNVNNRPV